VNFHEDLLIKVENQEKSMALVIDDHSYHIKRHLLYAWKPRVFFHILQHLNLMYFSKRNNIPTIKLDDILKLKL
jgi:hypothetical protein